MATSFLKHITSCILIALLPTHLLAQGGLIKGTVQTSDGQPASYVSVFLKENPHKGTTTATDGTFHIRNIKDGDYTLITSFVGFQTIEKSVHVVTGQILIVNFELSETSQQLAEIEVTDYRTLNEKTTSIGKADIKLIDLPQSVSVIDRHVLERQQSLQISDVLMNTNGVYVMGNSGGFQEEIAGRGFAFGSTNTFKNGARFNNAVMPEVSALERVEVLKGSNAILFGNVAAGGVLNLVTKKPTFEKGGEVSFRTGSYDFYKPSLDVHGAVGSSKHLAYRLNTSYQNSMSFRDNVSAERIYFNPSLLYKIDDKTDILIEGDYLKDNRTLDFGTAAIDYRIAKLPRDRFLNTSWAYYRAKQKSATLTANRKLTKDWNLRTMGSYQGFSNDQYGTTRPNSSSNFVKSDGTWVRGLQRSKTDQSYMLGQFDITGKFKTGTIEHNTLVGLDVDHYDNTTPAFVYKNAQGKNVYDTINIFDLSERVQRNDIPALDQTTLTKNPINRQGYYIQDLISVTHQLKVLAGVRYSKITSSTKVFDYAKNEYAEPVSYSDDAFTPRVGIVFQPRKNISIFTSYANSFALNAATDSLKNPLPASFIDQYEIGTKYDMLNGLLSLNVTAYKIINSNYAQPYLKTPVSVPNAQEITGEVTSKGIEVDIMSRPISGFSFIAGYSYNDTRFTKSKFYEENSRLRYNPSNTANASAYYTIDNGILKGLNFGVLGFYMGDRVAGRSTTVKNPTYKLMPVNSYFQLDASAGYSINNVSIRLKVSNLLNELSYNVHDDNSVNPIAPRMFAATVGYKW
jgi:iron complex outermembrane receptor protein